MNTLQKIKRNGSVLVLVLCVMMVLIVVGIGYLSLSLGSRMLAAHDASGIIARSAADAGLTKAIYMLDANLIDYQTRATTNFTPWTGIPFTQNMSTAGENCNATYTCRVDVNNANLYTYDITATGTANGSNLSSRTISAAVGPTGLADYAIHVQTTINLKKTTVDQYNNASNTPAFAIRTESTASGAITLQTQASVNGNAVVGYQGNPSTVISGSGITGSDTAAAAPYIFPPVILPTGFTNMGSISGTATIGTLGTSVKYQYSSISLGNKDTLTINGNVTLYVSGAFTSGNNSNLNISNGSSLILYIGGNMGFPNNVTIANNPNYDSTRLQIYGCCTTSNCQTISIGNGGLICGIVYAPYAAVSVNNGTTFRGTITAYSFDSDNNSSFFYDASLRSKNLGLTGAKRFAIRYWQEN